MTLQLTKAQRKAICNTLVSLLEGLPAIAPGHTAILDHAARPVTARIKDALSKQKRSMHWISDTAVASFLVERIEELLANRRDGWPESAEVPIRRLLGDLDSVAAILVDDLDSLPWRYRLLLPTCLPAEIAEDDGVEFGCGYRLVHFDEAAARSFPLHGFDEDASDLFHLDFPTELKWTELYFATEFEGFIPAYAQNLFVDEFVNAWKGLHGLLWGERLVQLNIWPGDEASKAMAIVIRRVHDDGVSAFGLTHGLVSMTQGYFGD